MQTSEFIKYLKLLKAADWKKKVTEKWTVKDLVAHLAAWEKANVKAITEALKAKQDPVWQEIKDEDAFNEESVKFYKKYSPKKLLNEWQKWDAKVKEAKKKNLKIYKTLSSWLAESQAHKEHHFRQIKKVLN